MKQLFSILLLAFSISFCASAAAPMIDRYAKHLKTSRDFTLRVAEQMPDDQYGFKLTPPQMSFAEQMIHIGESNLYFYSALTGGNEPFAKPSSQTKAEVISYLTKSFDYCLDILQKASTAQMDKSYKAEETSMSGWDIVMLSLDHTTHHRAQCEMYLRVKGITPTSYIF
jgi:uncharacterized damage-inducible protein DinB